VRKFLGRKPASLRVSFPPPLSECGQPKRNNVTHLVLLNEIELVGRCRGLRAHRSTFRIDDPISKMIQKTVMEQHKLTVFTLQGRLMASFGERGSENSFKNPDIRKVIEIANPE